MAASSSIDSVTSASAAATTQTPNSSVQVETITIFRSESDMTVSTFTGSILSVPTNFVGEPATRTLGQVPLFTGPCTDILLARITDNAGQVFEYPQMGCAAELPECCPYPFLTNVLLANCPIDYHTVIRGKYRACCPSSFDLYYVGIGAQTPCYSNLSYPLVPSTSVLSDVVLETKTALARSFLLAENHSTPDGHLAGGSIAGIVIGVLMGMGFITAAAILLCRRRRKQRQPFDVSSPIRATTEELNRDSKMLSVTLGMSPDPQVPALPPNYSHEGAQSEQYSQIDTALKHFPSPTLPANIHELPPFGGREHPAYRDHEDDRDGIQSLGTPDIAYDGYRVSSPISPDENDIHTKPNPLFLRKHLGVGMADAK